jgi:hypothetical protein
VCVCVKIRESECQRMVLNKGQCSKAQDKHLVLLVAYSLSILFLSSSRRSNTALCILEVADPTTKSLFRVVEANVRKIDSI